MANVYLHENGYTIECTRDNSRQDWYIVVILPDGTYGYDGWWRDSAGRTASDAVKEAKHGARLEDRQFTSYDHA